MYAHTQTKFSQSDVLQREKHTENIFLNKNTKAMFPLAHIWMRHCILMLL